MQQRKWFYVVGLVLLALSSLIFLRNNENVSESEASSDEINERTDHQRENQNQELQFTATALSSPPENANALVFPTYEFGGSSIGGAIRDRAGNLIWRATKDNPVFFISTSPDDGKIVVVGGDGKAYIITNEGNKIADLPQFPPGKDMFVFGYWIWLDNHRLLGGSGVQKFDVNGKSVGCCEGHDGYESRLYVYDLTTNQIAELQLPENLRGKVLIMLKVLKTGEFQLGHEGERFDWYQVTVTDLGENQ